MGEALWCDRACSWRGWRARLASAPEYRNASVAKLSRHNFSCNNDSCKLTSLYSLHILTSCFLPAWSINRLQQINCAVTPSLQITKPAGRPTGSRRQRPRSHSSATQGPLQHSSHAWRPRPMGQVQAFRQRPTGPTPPFPFPLCRSSHSVHAIFFGTALDSEKCLGCLSRRIPQGMDNTLL